VLDGGAWSVSRLGRFTLCDISNYRLDMRLGGFRADLDAVKKRQISVLPRIEDGFLGCPAYNLVAVTTPLSRVHNMII
jgi:hypothetical protein